MVVLVLQSLPQEEIPKENENMENVILMLNWIGQMEEKSSKCRCSDYVVDCRDVEVIFKSKNQWNVVIKFSMENALSKIYYVGCSWLFSIFYALSIWLYVWISSNWKRREIARVPWSKSWFFRTVDNQRYSLIVTI